MLKLNQTRTKGTLSRLGARKDVDVLNVSKDGDALVLDGHKPVMIRSKYVSVEENIEQLEDRKRLSLVKKMFSSLMNEGKMDSQTIIEAKAYISPHVA